MDLHERKRTRRARAKGHTAAHRSPPSQVPSPTEALTKRGMALEPLYADGSSVGSTGSTLLLALSRDPMTSVSPSSSTDVSASSSCLLDLVEVISVGSSDEEDGSMVVPLQLVHVKRESGSSRCAGGG